MVANHVHEDAKLDTGITCVRKIQLTFVFHVIIVRMNVRLTRSDNQVM